MKKRVSKRRGWFKSTPEAEEMSLRRRSDVTLPSQYEEIVRPIGSDSPKRRAFVSAKNGINCSPKRVSAGARLALEFD